MLKVYIEGYEMPCSRVQVETGIGPLSAQLVIPPGSYRRRILPGSRVMCMIQEGTEWFEWFQGTTTNMPETSLGFDEYPVTLNVIGDLGLLQSILMSYLTSGQMDMQNQTFKKVSMSGMNMIPRGTLGTLIAPFATTMANTEISFGDRIAGIIQAFVSMDPQGWEDLRRLQYLDRLAIEMSDEIANLSNRTLLGSIAEAIGSIQADSFTALDILNLILQLSMHELVSVAPMRCSMSQYIKKVNRFRNYLPKGLEITDLADMDQKTLVDKLCSREEVAGMMIDHFIKPMDRLHIPEVNKITRGMYNTAYVTDSGVTRSIFKITLMDGTKPVMMYEQLMPEQIKTVSDSVTAAINKSTNSPALGAVSSVMSERITGFRTNKEKVYGGVRTQYVPVDPRINHVLHALSNAEEHASMRKHEYQLDYVDSWMRSEHEKTNGSTVTIQNATFNLAPIPGFAVSVEDANQKIYTGKLVRKVDIIDLTAEQASSSYIIESCKADDALNYDGPVDLTLGTAGWFRTFGTNTEAITSPIFKNYKKSTVPKDLEIALTEFATYERGLVINHLMEESERVLQPEERFNREFLELQYEDDGKLPSTKTRMLYPNEEYYSDFDLLGEIAANSLRPESKTKGAVIIYYEAKITKQMNTNTNIIVELPDGTLAEEELQDGGTRSVGEEETTYSQVETKLEKDKINIDVGIIPGSSITIDKLKTHTLPDLKLTAKEAISILDTKNGNIFSVLAKSLSDETIKRKEAETPMKKIQQPKDSWEQYKAEYNEKIAAEAAAVENARIDGLNTDIHVMHMQYNPEFPLYLGNPSPLRIELLLYLMSGIPEGDMIRFLENGTFSSFDTDSRPAIPRPLSERQVITLRREIARRASDE